MTNFRHRYTGQVVQLGMEYANPTHPFYDTFELLGDEYEDEKVVVEASSDATSVVPPKSAAKSAWLTYASAAGYDVPDSMTKADIIALVAQPVEDQPPVQVQLDGTPASADVPAENPTEES